MNVALRPDRAPESAALRLDRERSALLVVDCQARLMPAIQGADLLVDRARLVLQAAEILEIPTLVTEQHPKGLGRTVAAVTAALPSGHGLVEKQHFSACDEPACRDWLSATGRDQLILLGAEAHVCVLQTALGLLERRFGQVWLIADAIGSRAAEDKSLALARAREAGMTAVTSEMVCFEWLRTARAPAFKSIQALIKPGRPSPG